MNTSRFQEHLSDLSPSEASDHPRLTSRRDLRDGTDIITQIREATSAPSPLTSYLKDPAVISALDASDGTDHSRSHRHSSSSRSRHSSSILGLVLAEEEKQAHHLKSVLRSTGDRLDREIRRGNQTLARAEQAEARVRELTSRVTAAESGRHYAELEATRAKEEIKRHQLRIESLETEIRRLQSDVALLERQRNEADESASRARDTARKFQLELRTVQARETGRDEGQRFGMHKWFNSGRMEGYDAGHAQGFQSGHDEGFEEGREYGFVEGQEIGIRQGQKIGKQEGYDEGWEQGRRVAREDALQAFDELFTAEIDQHDNETKKQAKRWSNWMRRATSPPVPKPKWPRRPLYADVPQVQHR
ncbi:hypothetical protein ID866_517 [Astraeus odoratus]|nr:hypothetical protein ID866_517 [Astraeus odoratus]